MRVAMIIRSTAFKASGGDTVQARATAKYLYRLGVSVDVKSTMDIIDYQQYDLMHFFNIIRPSDILYHVKHSALPFVISPIFVNYQEYERSEHSGLRKWLSHLLSLDAMEYVKVMARTVFNKEPLRSPDYMWKGHRSSVKQLMAGCSLLLPNSKSEAQRLFDHYQIRSEYKVVYNGIDEEVFSRPETDSDRNGVLCVAQFHPSKNQLRLIRALRSTGIQLTLVGRPTINGKLYYEKCKKEAGPNVRFIDFVPQEQLSDLYRAAEVHILPSWFETTGLVSLEAAAMGCKIVTTNRGDVREYFGDQAIYCDPSSVNSIREKVHQAAQSPFSPELQERVYKDFTWEKAAIATLEAYENVLS